MRVGSGVILFQLAGFLTSALADFYFAKHISRLSISILWVHYPDCIKSAGLKTAKGVKKPSSDLFLSIYTHYFCLSLQIFHKTVILSTDRVVIHNPYTAFHSFYPQFAVQIPDSQKTAIR